MRWFKNTISSYGIGKQEIQSQNSSSSKLKRNHGRPPKLIKRCASRELIEKKLSVQIGRISCLHYFNFLFHNPRGHSRLCPLYHVSEKNVHLCFYYRAEWVWRTTFDFSKRIFSNAAERYLNRFFTLQIYMNIFGNSIHQTGRQLEIRQLSENS